MTIGELFISVAIVSLFTISTTGVGVALCQILVPSSPWNLRIAVGILVGGGLFVMLGTFFSPEQATFWIIALLLLLAASLYWLRAAKTAGSARCKSALTSGGQSLSQAIGVASIGMNRFSIPWTVIGFSILLLPQVGLLKVTSTSLRRTVSLVVGIAGLVLFRLSMALQPSWWQPRSDDMAFAEATGVIASTLGSATHPGFSELDLHSYHTLGYWWPGLVTIVSDLPSFVATGIVLPLISGTSIALLLFANRSGDQRNAALTAFLVASFLLAHANWGFPSVELGNWAILAYALVRMEISKSPICDRGIYKSIGHEIILGIIGLISVLGKGTTLPFIGLVGLTIGLTEYFRLRPRTHQLLRLVLPIHLVLVTTVGILKYSGANELITTSRLSPIQSLPYGSIAFIKSLIPLLDRGPELVVIGITCLILLHKRLVPDPSIQNVLMLVTIGLAPIVAATTVGEVALQTYLTHQGYFFCLAILVKMSAEHTWSQSEMISTLKVLAWLTPAVLGVAIYRAKFLTDHLSSVVPLDHDNRLKFAIPELEFPILLLAILVAGTRVRRSVSKIAKLSEGRMPSDFSRIAVYSLLFATSLSLTAMSDDDDSLIRDIRTDIRLQDNAFDRLYPDQDTFEVGRWFQENTPRTSLVATNSFCCDNNLFLPQALLELRDHERYWTRYDNHTFGGSNYFLSATTQRRFVVAGPRFVVGLLADTTRLQVLLSASVRFGATLEPRYSRPLLNAGAKYFILDKRVRPVNPRWREELVLFENDRYVVLNLSN